MANHIFTIGLALGLVMAFGAAAQPGDKPAKDAPQEASRDASQAIAKSQDNRSETAKKHQSDSRDISRDPDRSAIGPRTTQGLAQDAISRSNSP